MKNKLHNKTRTSDSIPKKLLSQGKLHLIPLYYLLTTSYLANEAITNSGSYLLADHIYQAKPKGSFGFGVALDALLLSLPSAKSFRNRYLYSKVELHEQIEKKEKDILRILTIPSGIPRDLIDICKILVENKQIHTKKIQFICMDLDPKVLTDTEKHLQNHKVAEYFTLINGDALEIEHYPKDIDIVVSNGLGEFLTDDLLHIFYQNVYHSLNEEGVFITSAVDKHHLSEFLLREIGEVITNYRTKPHLEDLITQSGFETVKSYTDAAKLQSMIVATK
jgi:hypothetical protein